jgi:hypothetical protein
MKIEKLANGYVRITAEKGVRSKVTNRIYSEVVCMEEEVELYEAVK